MTEAINNFAKALFQAGFATPFINVRGCQKAEITGLEKHLDIKLPTAYKDFLKKMGHKAGSFMQGTDMFYGSLFDNREGLEAVLELENYPFELKKSFFVFFSHQGYIFNFFDTEEDPDDPTVYFYQEGMSETMECLNEKFSDFLFTILELQKKNRFRRVEKS